MHTCWHGRSARPIVRPPRSGGGSEPAAAHSLRERRGAMARPRRQLAYRGYPVTPMVAHMLARAVGAADCSTTEKRRRERAGCGAHSARVSGSDGAPAQAACVPWVSGHNDGCTHVGTGGRRGRSFDHREAAARIEPVDVLTCMRMTVRLCAKEYRFETSGDMWHGESCGYRRMSS